MVALQLDRWEIGAFGRWDFEHGTGRTAAGRKIEVGAAGAGIAVGRREQVGIGHHRHRRDGRRHAAWQELGRLEIEEASGSSAPHAIATRSSIRASGSMREPWSRSRSASVCALSSTGSWRPSLTNRHADLQPLAAWNVGFTDRRRDGDLAVNRADRARHVARSQADADLVAAIGGGDLTGLRSALRSLPEPTSGGCFFASAPVTWTSTISSKADLPRRAPIGSSIPPRRSRQTMAVRSGGDGAAPSSTSAPTDARSPPS